MHITDAEKAFAAPALELIKGRWPDVYTALRAAQPCENLSLPFTYPHPTFSVDEIQLASSYDPEGEAQLQASRIPENSSKAWVYGVGMGYLPRQLLEKHAQLKRLNVVLMNVPLFFTMLHWIDQTEWLSDERVTLELASEDSPLEYPYAVTPPCLFLASEAAASLTKCLKSDLNLPFVAEQQWARLSRIVGERLRENVGFVRDDHDVAELFHDDSRAEDINEFVVVGAGPTLSEQYESISRSKENGAIIIAVDAAAKLLFEQNLVPDIVVSVDPHRKTLMKFFSFDLSFFSETKLVYFPAIHKDVLTLWPYERYVAYPNSSSVYDDLRRHFDRGTLFSSGSVIHSAVDLAVKMGSDKVYLAGVDLSFPGNMSHAKGIHHVEKLNPNGDDPDYLYVKNGYGKKVLTQDNMLAYKRALEMYINKHPGVEFYNMSRGGAEIRGARYV